MSYLSIFILISVTEIEYWKQRDYIFSAWLNTHKVNRWLWEVCLTHTVSQFKTKWLWRLNGPWYQKTFNDRYYLQLFTNYAISLFHGGGRQGREAKLWSCALRSPGAGLGGSRVSVPKEYTQLEGR